MSSEIPFGPDGFVDMDAFLPLDPDEALREEVYQRLHEALVEAPVRVVSEPQWETMLETALQEPAFVETDWLVPTEAPVPGDTVDWSMLDSTDVADLDDDIDWSGSADELTDPQGSGDEDTVDGDDLL